MSNYDVSYKGKLARIQALIESGEKSVTRILSIIETESVSQQQIDNNRALKEMELSRQKMGYAFDGNNVKVAEHSMDVAMIIHRAQVAALIRKYLPENTQRIVELGSGIGANLFWLWSMGTPADADYIGYEYAEHGNKCLTTLAQLLPRQNMQAYSFDYNLPEFTQLEKNVNTVVITVHSIEQIKYIDASLIRKIKSIPGFSRCVHIEPVGYQMSAGVSDWLDYQNESWSTLRNSYNRNLLKVLADMQENMELKIIRTSKHIGGIHAGNSSSLVIWEN